MNRYRPPIGRAVAPDVAVIFGFVSAGLMFTSAMLNVVVAVNFNAAVRFMSVYGIASKAGLFLIGYARMHYIGVRRWRATSTLDCDRPTASLRQRSGAAHQKWIADPWIALRGAPQENVVFWSRAAQSCHQSGALLMGKIVPPAEVIPGGTGNAARALEVLS
jgi:hypothetical protein